MQDHLVPKTRGIGEGRLRSPQAGSKKTETFEMDEASFRRDRAAEGYEDFNLIDWPAGQLNDMHTHEFGAHALILEGEITVTTEDGKATTCRSGDTFALAGGIRHEEIVGPNGVKLISARK
jgi:quercetin dioxygenase-like cupin family protein